jgi:ferric-dicitrate binding protein FerR (iron transport regulator)
MPDPQTVDGWIQAHLAGELDADAAAGLRAWLRAEPGNQRRFFEAVRFHEELGHAAAELSRQRASSDSAVMRGVGRSARRRAQAARLRWPPVPMPTLWLSLAAVLILGIATWLLLPPSAAAPPVVRLAWGAGRSDAGAAVPTGSRLADGVWLTAVEPACLQWQDGSQVILDPGSRVACTATGLTLGTGRLAAEIRPHPVERPFSVATAEARVVVVGTRFTVAAESRRTDVSVDSGRVRVATPRGGERLLTAGDMASVGEAGVIGRVLRVAPAGTAHPAATHPTIAAAVAAARPGDTVLLLPGRHGLGPGGATDVPVRITASGLPGAPIVLRAQPGATLVSDAWNAIHLQRCAWIELRDLRLRYQGSARSDFSGNGIVIDDSTHITAAGCDIAGFGGDGINSTGGDYLNIADNRIEGCGGGRLGVQGGITIGAPVAADDAPGPHNRIVHNRILRSAVGAPNHRTPGRWTGGHGILLHNDPAATYARRTLVAGNQVIACAGPGISVSFLAAVDIEDNLLHANGHDARTTAPSLLIQGSDCTASRNLIIPADGRSAWRQRRELPVVRTGNRVWEPDQVQRPEVAPDERMTGTPYATPVADEASRSDVTLLPGIGAGPR